MAETIKSVLLVDYDSLHRSLKTASKAAADRLSDVSAWVAGIESGRLVVPSPDPSTRRRILTRRCYVDPRTLGAARAGLVKSGFRIVECQVPESGSRSSADLQIALDANDAVDQTPGFDEFILIAPDSDLTPVINRLKAKDRRVAIYQSPLVAVTNRALADCFIDEGRLIALLTGRPAPAEPDPEDEPVAEQPRGQRAPSLASIAVVSGDRGEVETLARKVHAATNVPLYSPKTFAELFRQLSEEIRTTGYHFQTTAENVASRLVTAGRNVTKRQVMFVVKGLALKGHVFSNTDTAERLAEVFREQVLYLAGSAGLNLDDREQGLLTNWIVGQAGRPTPPAPVAKAPGMKPPSAKETAEAILAKSAKRKPLRPVPQEKAPPQPLAKPAEPKVAPKPKEPARPSVFRSTSSAPTAASAAKAISAAARFSAGSGANAARPAPQPAAQPKPEKPAPEKPALDSTANAIESSILAAIAEAVDVLVADSGGKSDSTFDLEPSETPAPPPSRPAARKPPPEAPPRQKPAPKPSPAAEPGDDIGDEIQRILANYNRNRQQEGS